MWQHTPPQYAPDTQWSGCLQSLPNSRPWYCTRPNKFRASKSAGARVRSLARPLANTRSRTNERTNKTNYTSVAARHVLERPRRQARRAQAVTKKATPTAPAQRARRRRRRPPVPATLRARVTTDERQFAFVGVASAARPNAQRARVLGSRGNLRVRTTSWRRRTTRAEHGMRVNTSRQTQRALRTLCNSNN